MNLFIGLNPVQMIGLLELLGLQAIAFNPYCTLHLEKVSTPRHQHPPFAYSYGLEHPLSDNISHEGLATFGIEVFLVCMFVTKHGHCLHWSLWETSLTPSYTSSFGQWLMQEVPQTSNDSSFLHSIPTLESHLPLNEVENIVSKINYTK